MNSIAAKARAVCRTVVLSCVISGLLFSCGEGIQLLPFPVSEGAIDAGIGTAIFARSSRERNTLHREQTQAKKQFKPKRGDDRIARGPSGAMPGVDLRLSAAKYRRDLLHDAAFLPSRIAPSQSLGRAPPLS